MIRHELFSTTLVLVICLVRCEVTGTSYNGSNKGEPPDKQDQQSFMTNLASWILPFSLTSQAEERGDRFRYLPPPSQSHIDCNACNREPWIPITSPSFRAPVKNFLQSHHGNDLNFFETLHPPPAAYRAPARPINLYKPTSITIVDYMVPPPVHYKIPAPIYGPPKPRPAYGPPRPLQYFPTRFTPPPDQNLVVPSDSYGTPVTGDSLNYFNQPPNSFNHYKGSADALIHYKEPVDSFKEPVGSHYKEPGHSSNYFSPPEQLSLANEHEYAHKPIPLPNLSEFPVLPLRNFENFKENFIGGEDAQVQVQPSVQVADYLAAIEHPISVVQSPLIELSVKEEREGYKEKIYDNIGEKLEDSSPGTKLSENPIVVEDIHAAASNNNASFSRDNGKALDSTKAGAGTNIIKKLLLGTGNNTVPPLDYNDWRPSYGVTMSSLKVVPNSLEVSNYSTSTTKQPKVLQIIVPYVKNKPLKKHWFNGNKEKQSYTTLLPVYTPPPTTEVSVWTKYLLTDFKAVESNPVVATAVPKTTTAVYNIQEFLSKRTTQNKVPFDMISLQKHIDDWTQQAYSQNTERTKDHLSTPKRIPNEYLAVKEVPTTTTRTVYQKPKHFIETDDIFTNTIEVPETGARAKKIITITPKPVWDVSQVTVSPQTKEKVYVVTPQAYNFRVATTTPATAWSAAPKIENGRINNASTYDSYKFSIRVEPQNQTGKEKFKKEDKEAAAVKIVYSEWPHLINNLVTTTVRSTSRHPLFGLMDSIPYTPPPNATVETIFGHSRVATAVTSTPASKSNTGFS